MTFPGNSEHKSERVLGRVSFLICIMGMTDDKPSPTYSLGMSPCKGSGVEQLTTGFQSQAAGSKFQVCPLLYYY